jgi:25S rRNA (adenine2142-N1)-methyltransferase
VAHAFGMGRGSGKSRGGLAKMRPLVPPPMNSLRRARSVTSSFHTLTRQLQEASAAGRRADAARLAAEVERLGGRAAYQEASVLTTSRSRATAKYVFAALTRHGLRPARGAPPLPLLEVGAVNTQLLSVPWLAVRAIDIRSSHPRIEQRDFFDLAPAAEYGAVVCSMARGATGATRARRAHQRWSDTRPPRTHDSVRKR